MWPYSNCWDRSADLLYPNPVSLKPATKLVSSFFAGSVLNSAAVYQADPLNTIKFQAISDLDASSNLKTFKLKIDFVGKVPGTLGLQQTLL